MRSRAAETAALHARTNLTAWDEWMDWHTAHWVHDIDPYVMAVQAYARKLAAEGGGSSWAACHARLVLWALPRSRSTT